MHITIILKEQLVKVNKKKRGKKKENKTKGKHNSTDRD
jgi:hypothetical protein